MSVTKELQDFVAQFEGFALKSYQDPNGIWTIGRGHTGHDVGPGIEWTEDHVNQQFLLDITVAQSQLLEASPITWPDANTQNALTDFVFNLGIGRYKGSTMKKYVDTLQWEQVKTELVKWCHDHSGEVLPDLLERRQKECKLIGVQMGIFGNNSASPRVPEQPDQRVGWTPTMSTSAGAGLGLAVCTVSLYILSLFTKVNPPLPVVGAWGVICTALCGYIFKDGGRK